MNSSSSARAVRVLSVLWPAFMVSIVLEGLLFTLFEPMAMRWSDGLGEPLSPLAVYSLGFLVIWGCIWACMSVAVAEQAASGGLLAQLGLRRRRPPGHSESHRPHDRRRPRPHTSPAPCALPRHSAGPAAHAAPRGSGAGCRHGAATPQRPCRVAPPGRRSSPARRAAAGRPAGCRCTWRSARCPGRPWSPPPAPAASPGGWAAARPLPRQGR